LGRRELKLFWKIWDASFYIYIIVCFISLAVLIFGLNNEINTNPSFKDALFCSKPQLNYTEYGILEPISEPFQKKGYKECTSVMEKISEKANNIYLFCMLYIFVYLGLMLYFNKNFREGVISDLQNLEKILTFKKNIFKMKKNK
jgi:hypothetical protein